MKSYIFIGDNEKVLRAKEHEFENKVDIIYIDPPYNTKSQKSFFDAKYSDETWKKMMFPRLSLGRKILNDKGIILISIDDNQLANLKLICDEIFGKENFLGIFITYQSLKSNSKHINTIHEYVLAFAKCKKKVPKLGTLRKDDMVEGPLILNIMKKVKKEYNLNGIEAAKKCLNYLIKISCEKYKISWLKNYNKINDKGEIFFAKDLSTPGIPRKVNIPSINLYLEPLDLRGWSSDKKLIRLHNEKRLFFVDKRPYEIAYLSEARDNVFSLLNFYSRQGSSDLAKLGLKGLFDAAKPVGLIKYLINLYPGEKLTICDFFAGSGTTAQAVLELNRNEKKDHNFILIQSKEPLNSNSVAYKKALELKIKPCIADIMIHRINAYINGRNYKEDDIQNIEYHDEEAWVYEKVSNNGKNENEHIHIITEVID